MPKESKDTSGGRWIQEIKTRDTVEEKEGTFSGNNSAEEIAIELKRKAPNFQAAMGKVTFYLNRAGKRLSESRKKELNRVKELLREMYDRKDRELANKGTKSASVNELRYSSQWAVWKDPQRKEHVGDQYLELLLADPGMIRKVHPEVKPQDLKEYKKWLLKLYKNEIPHPNPETKKEEEEDFELIRKKMSEQLKKGINVPIFELDRETMKPKDPTLIPKVACVENKTSKGNELIFASENQALQYLSDFVKKIIKVP